MTTLSINIPVLARVEGSGALELRIEHGAIAELKLRIFEPPRFFEKLLEGREAAELPDAVARICGICPVAYQMSACLAVEHAFGCAPGPWVAAMRRLFYCGEWIASHNLHLHLLAAPDFFGANSVIELADTHPDEVRRGLRLQDLGNRIMGFLGARSVHPVGARLGGFHRAPEVAEAAALREALSAALPEARALATWVASWDVPVRRQDFESIALDEAGVYPFMARRMISDRGLAIDIADFEREFAETQVAHSTALHCTHRGRPYLVGPLARLNLHAALLPDEVRALAAGRFPSANVFDSALARALEVYYALLEAVRLLTDYRPAPPHEDTALRAGVGVGASEAPRGTLWHRYGFDAAGRIAQARIVPPTSQNQARIEDDLRLSLGDFGLDRPEPELRAHAEQVIRNYDPCISCATHFLDLRLIRS
jgi:coenzyme F420-reducing hydrogenase alpha subunit